MHGKFVDATPFRDAVKKTNGEKESKSSLLVDDLGSMLKEKGFNYYGTETLYSGSLGVELKCEIFMGPVYYQRLRHMVSDKFQVFRPFRLHLFYRPDIRSPTCTCLIFVLFLNHNILACRLDLRVKWIS